MRKVREVLRLRHALSLSYREISEALGVGKTAAGEIVRRAEVVGLTWPLPEVFDDGELERRLFTAPGEAQPERPAPAWAQLHEELKRRSVTLVLLWQEYRAEHSDGYGYSRFCDLYGAWRRSVSVTMRQTHVAGEKLFVDFAGDTVAVIDPLNGDTRRAHIFVAALGASNFTYAEARWSEGLADWISVHVNALGAIGGVPKAVVYDYVPGHIIVQNRLRHTPEERERPNVAVAEGFRRLRRIGHHEAGVAVRQVHRKEVDLALDATDDADRFAEVGLRMSRRMHQRNEHLLSPLTPAGHIILHNCDATRKAVFVPKPFEQPLGRMLLLLRS